MHASTPMLGAVLVGGASRRMGVDKALIVHDGRPLVELAAARLADAGCQPVVAIGPSRLAASVASLADRWPGEGPLGGVLTALGHAAPALVIACDMPWLTVDALRQLLDADCDDADVVIAVSDRPEPLCALWLASSAATLQRHFDHGERSIRRVLPDLRVRSVAMDVQVLRSANAPDQLWSE